MRIQYRKFQDKNKTELSDKKEDKNTKTENFSCVPGACEYLINMTIKTWTV